MAKRAKKTKKIKRGLIARLWRMIFKAALAIVILVLIWIFAYTIINPPIAPYMFTESRRLGGLDREWVAMEDIAPVMARSAVAAEDANFCLHWGFDMAAIRAALEEGGARGASTISQQVTKNVFLWHGRSYTRKALEAVMTPAIETIWSKRRVLEVYLNIAEFDEGVFGVEAAAQHYFGVSAKNLSATQAARLAVVLPNPKGRSASRPSAVLRKKAARVADGAATIRVDGRAACFES